MMLRPAAAWASASLMVDASAARISAISASRAVKGASAESCVMVERYDSYVKSFCGECVRECT